MASPPSSAGDDSWFSPLSIDLLLKVANITLLHPFITALIPLCLRARTVHWDAPPMIASIVWAAVVSLFWALAALNRRVAHGKAREVDLSEEVIVVTGGAGGLGLLLAEVYGMRGASVAVLDVVEMENGEQRGVTWYKCDVGNKEQLAKVAKEIEEDVSPLYAVSRMIVTNMLVTAGNTYSSGQQRRSGQG